MRCGSSSGWSPCSHCYWSPVRGATISRSNTTWVLRRPKSSRPARAARRSSSSPPDRVTYRPELGVLYPSELAEGMRIYVEYDRNNPDLVRVQHRTAALAIIPAGSIAVVAWLIGGLFLTGLVLLERRVNQVDISLDNQLLS